MLASFIIGFHTARIDNLLQTLRFLTADHADVVSKSQLSLVCQDHSDTLPQPLHDQLELLREKFHRSCLIDLQLKCMHLPLVTNVGVEDAETDKLIILESDRILPAGYFASVIRDIREGVQITTKKILKLTTPATDEEIREGLFVFKDDIRGEVNQIGCRNMWSGNTAIHKADYYKAGMMDEAYLGYGWADSDMTNAMAKVGVGSEFRDEVELHLWHPPATYGEGDQKKMFLDNGMYFCKKWNIPYPQWFISELAQHKGLRLMI